MSPSSRLALTGLLLALPLSARTDDQADASSARVAALAAEAAARVKSGQIAELYGERTRNDAGAGVAAGGPRGTRADANLPGSQLPANFKTTLPAPPEPDRDADAAPARKSLITRVRDWWSPPETPPGKFVENPSFARAECGPGESPPCPMKVMLLNENSPTDGKLTDFVEYGVIEGGAFVQPRWWEFWKDSKQVSPDEIGQGGIGDCFLMAALAAIARKEPDVLREMIRQHKTTQAAFVRFYDGVPAKEVLVGPVDNLFPVWKAGSTHGTPGQSVFAKQLGGPPPPKWPLIIEKAYAVHFREGSYAELNQGGRSSVAMTQITGRPSQTITVNPKSPAFKKLIEFSELLKWDTNGQPIVIGTKSSPEAGCPPAAAASVSSAPAVSTGAAAVELSDDVCTDPLYFDKAVCTPDAKDPVCKAAKIVTLAEGHAYWVKNVDAGTQMVTLANPWGPRKDLLVVWPWERLQKSLNRVYVNEKK